MPRIQAEQERERMSSKGNTMRSNREEQKQPGTYKIMKRMKGKQQLGRIAKREMIAQLNAKVDASIKEGWREEGKVKEVRRRDGMSWKKIWDGLEEVK